jgi:hypothetical protein
MPAQAITTAPLQVHAEATNHFQTTNTECDICKSADAPEPSSDAIVRLHVRNHIFHHHCIDVWLLTQLNRPDDPSHGTCPLCRDILVEHPDLDLSFAALRREAARLARVQGAMTIRLEEVRRRIPARSYDVRTEEEMQRVQKMEDGCRRAEELLDDATRHIAEMEAILDLRDARLGQEE